MIKSFADAGGDERKMWSSVDVTAEAMEYLKEVSPEKYECVMRKLSEALYGKHYDEEMAYNDAEKIFYVDANGVKHVGAHWSVEEINAATKDKTPVLSVMSTGNRCRACSSVRAVSSTARNRWKRLRLKA